MSEEMNIGYACLTLAVPGTALHKCRIGNADGETLCNLIGENLAALERMIDYNAENGIRLYRISSDIVPFASSPVNRVEWARVFGARFRAIGMKIRESGMRVSMHPGQYTVLNSPDERVVRAAEAELAYHAEFLDALGVDSANKLILHLGGAYGDKGAAMERFGARYEALPENVKSRLVIENDDKVFTIAEVLAVGEKHGIPVVFDNLHHLANPSREGMGEFEWIERCAHTWRERDGRQKIHYSQPDPLKKSGAHSQSIAIDGFLRFYEALPEPKPDIMLEVKDKNLSAIKCGLCVAEKPAIAALEREWARYKYAVLEHSQAAYDELRALLKDKSACPAAEFYRIVEGALKREIAPGDARNAAMHVWGYFKDAATAGQKAAFLKALDGYASGAVKLDAVKRKLYALAVEYGRDYLLHSYYFLP